MHDVVPTKLDYTAEQTVDQLSVINAQCKAFPTGDQMKGSTQSVRPSVCPSSAFKFNLLEIGQP